MRNEQLEQDIISSGGIISSYQAYADWLSEQGDPRGEFVRVQLKLEEKGVPKNVRAKLRRRQNALLKKHRIEWLGPLASLLGETTNVEKHTFERGFSHTIQSRSVTDGELACLHEYPLLHTLDLRYNSEVTEAGLAHVGGLGALRVLNLVGTETTDRGLGKLIDSSLHTLYLGFTAITDAGLVNVGQLGSLRRLTLNSNRAFTDDGLAHLSKLIGLEDLKLSHTNVTDSGLAHLATMKHLQTIDLGDTDLTDAGLAHLMKIGALRTLRLGDLADTAFSKGAISKLRQQCYVPAR